MTDQFQACLRVAGPWAQAYLMDLNLPGNIAFMMISEAVGDA